MSVTEGLPKLPPMPAVAAALRAITERLAGELANPREVPPDWSEFDWRAARAVAAMHGISGLLAERLLWRGPQGWVGFLDQQRDHIASRQLRLQELLAVLAERCQLQGIPLLALKGAALHGWGLYRLGQRPMADLDLLTPPQHLSGATSILESLGFRESHRTFKHRVFEPCSAALPQGFGEHAGNAMKVELHERICEPLPYHLTDITPLVLPPDARPGLNPYPSSAALMAHLLLHAAGGMAYRTLRLIQLHDIGRLAARQTPADWRQLLDWGLWWVWPALMLTERYYGACTPQPVTRALKAFCPVILRRTCARQRLSDVSLSRLWLEAFPGIEWAQSLREVVRFVARRVVPSGEVRSDRKFALAADPSLAHGDWAGLSQTRRILRALRARTPRPWPLHNVRAAVAEPS